MPDTDIESDTYIEDTNDNPNSYKKRIFLFFGVGDYCCLTFVLFAVLLVLGIICFIIVLEVRI
jgi:hypothetical protein